MVWQRFIDSLDSPGGHVLISMLVMVFAVGFMSQTPMSGDSHEVAKAIIMTALGWLGRSMIGRTGTAPQPVTPVQKDEIPAGG